jgi:hypothetical protein
MDLVAADFPGLLLAMNDGVGHFADARHAVPQFESSYVLAVGDVDRDDDLDIVVGVLIYPDGPLHLLLNDGTGTFVEDSSRIPVTANNPRCVRLADVDGDQDLDIIVGNHDNRFDQTPPNRLFLNDGHGYFSERTGEPLGRGPCEDVAVADVDADGDLDLLFGYGTVCDIYGNCSDKANKLLLNSGTGQFTVSTGFSAIAESTQCVLLDDFDGDGDPDAFVGNGGGDPDRFYLNNGRGVRRGHRSHPGARSHRFRGGHRRRLRRRSRYGSGRADHARGHGQ